MSNTFQFPDSEYAAIALVHIQKQDTSSMSPEDVYKLFKETERKIYQYAMQNRDQEWMHLR
ncbi:MAG: hypothetical protein ACLSX5_13690 [Lachnospiraceae bacterium]